MSEWQQLSLGSLMEIIGGGTPKTSVSGYWGGDIPWLSVVDFNTGLKFVSSTEKTITQEGLNNSSTKLLNKGDIIISARGTVGVLAILDKPMTFNQSCYGIRSKKGISDTDYLYYLLTDTVRELTQISHGGVFDTITKATFDEIEVAVPPLPEQKAIASVLSSLDDKIDLLHRQNKTLEAMAETLFRQWFIEEAKEDWEEVTLADVCTRITDGSHSSPASVEEGYPMASVKDMYDWGINQATCRKISKEDYEALVQADCKALQGDILIAKDGSYLKHVFLLEKSLDVVLLSSIAMLRPNGRYNPMLLTLFLKLDSTHELMQNIVTGAVIPRIVLKDFRKFPIQLPPKDLQDKAVKIVKPIFEKCWENNRQIQTLENLRDTLLPKLMSGEVRVQYQTEEVA
ncbi:restriction endonuclease subunit S [Acinetobacter towneri]|uniref:restriction endonuclease subunit S n=1 Tax=Acinetobacter towneri TaxID=202956 RepID=UPI0014440421|nr:restriction endonuclease subunit S [Acinetobacter towneri]